MDIYFCPFFKRGFGLLKMHGRKYILFLKQLKEPNQMNQQPKQLGAQYILFFKQLKELRQQPKQCIYLIICTIFAILLTILFCILSSSLLSEPPVHFNLICTYWSCFFVLISFASGYFSIHSFTCL
jgi:hypothetical protein